MSEGNGSTSELIPAVAYLRVSDDDSENSIPQQRREINAWAEGKYLILREYVDSGKSGSKDQDKRVAFRRLLLDSARGEFRAVLCWKTNRFARLDSLEGAEAKKTLRANGVYLDTVKDGLIDWDTMAGRIVDTVRAEMDHAYSRSLASDSLRGRVAALERGCWPNGSVPYAYLRLYVAPDGRELVVRRTEAFRKPEGWSLHLIVCEEEAEVVRWVFERLCSHDASLRSIARDLNARGVPSPVALGKGGGTSWTVVMVKDILTNPAYCGVGYLGAGRTRKRGAFNLAEDVRKAGVCPAIVEPATWEGAQAVLAGRARPKRRPREGSGALSGVLFCSHCGCRMAATHWKGRAGYVCASAGRKPGATPCRRWSVYEDELLPAVCARLVETVDGELVRALAVRPPVSDRLGDLEVVRQQMADLEGQLEVAADRYLKAPVELMPRLLDRLKAMRAELTELEEKARRLACEAGEGPVASFARWWEGVRGQLLLVRVARRAEGETSGEGARAFWMAVRDTATPGARGVDEPLPDASCALVEPQALRGLLLRLGVRVECSFKRSDTIRKKTPGRGRGREWVLSRAVMTLRGEGAEHQVDEGVSQYTPPGAWCLPSPIAVLVLGVA